MPRRATLFHNVHRERLLRASVRMRVVRALPRIVRHRSLVPALGRRVGSSWPPGSEMTVGDFFGGTRRGKNEVSAVGTGAVPDWARVEARAKDPRRHSTHRALRPSLKVRPPSLCPTSRSLSSTRPHARASAGVELQSFTSRARLDFREVFARARAERRRRGRPRRRGSPRRARRRRASSAQTSAKRTSVAAAAPFCVCARARALSALTQDVGTSSRGAAIRGAGSSADDLHPSAISTSAMHRAVS